MLSDGADVNGTNPGGQTALILAALMGRAGIVRLLLEAGADVRQRDNLGLTAIDWAQRKGFSEVTQLLVSLSTTNRSAGTVPPKQAEEAEEDQGFRERDRVGDMNLTSVSEARETPSGSESRADVGFGPAAIAMLKTKARLSNHDPTAIRSEPIKKESISSEPDTLRARLETERIFEEARLRVEQEVRKKTQEQAGSTFDKEPFEEEPPTKHQTVSESTVLKRCPKCNTIYDDGYRMYCAYDAGRLVDVDRPVEGAGTSAFGRPTLWALVAVTLVGSVVITYLATRYLTHQAVSTPPAAAATETAPNIEENSPVVGGALVGKELNVPNAEYPSTARSAGTSATVTVVIRVNRNGRVTSANALNGDAPLRAAAEKAARKATFSPEKLANEERIVAGTITYTFKPGPD